VKVEAHDFKVRREPGNQKREEFRKHDEVSVRQNKRSLLLRDEKSSVTAQPDITIIIYWHQGF
jgi:hypothetical protein